MASSRPFAIIVGVGPGTSAAVARTFSKAYPVVLLARNQDSYQPLADEINKNGGKALGISTDVSSSSSIKSAFQKIEQEFQGAKCAAAIFNASGKFYRKGILDMSEEEFSTGWEVSGKGAFLFTQAALPLMLPLAKDSSTKYPPTIIYTGATASVKSNALMSGFSTAKYALRALSQSVAREFAPQGIHVAHAIIDGVIDIPRTKDWLKDMPPEAKIDPQGIADAYWNLHTQPKTAFTNEIDIRPMLEKW